MKSKELQQQFEATGFISWLNSDLYPDGKIYSKEYTEWLEEQTKLLTEQLTDTKEAYQLSCEVLEQFKKKLSK